MRGAVLGSVLAVLALAGSAGAKEQTAYGLQIAPQTSVLARLDPGNLAMVGPKLRLGPFGQAWSLDLTGSRLVSGSVARSTLERPARLLFVDLRRMRVEGTLRIEGELGTVTGTAWAGGRVLATINRASGVTVILSVDPGERRILARTTLTGQILRGARTHAGLVLLLAPAARLGPPTLAVVDARARVRSVRLARLSAGSRQRGQGEEFRVELRQPALSLNRTGSKAYVLGSGQPPATVDLRTLRVRYADARTLAKRISGWSRYGALLGGELVYSGYDYDLDRSRPAGAWLVDPGTWRTRTLDEEAGMVVVRSGLAFAFSNGPGLRVYGEGGRERFRVFGGRPVGWVQATAMRALVTFSGPGEQAAVVDLANGVVVRRLADPPQLLAGRGEALWS